MKPLLALLLIFICILFSCSGGNGKRGEKELPRFQEFGTANVLDRDGVNKPKVVLRALDLKIRFDSSVWDFVIDKKYLFGVERMVVRKDTTGKAIDSSAQWVQIGVDSVSGYKFESRIDSILNPNFRKPIADTIKPK